MNKRILVATALVAVILCGVAIGMGEYETITAALAYPITVQYNGEIQAMVDATGARVYPITYNGTTYLPVRAVSNMLGLVVDWEQDTQTVILKSAEQPQEATSPMPEEMPANTITYYADFPSVPDFGVLAGISPTMELGSKEKGTKVYLYDPMDFKENTQRNYWDLIESEGFQYMGSFQGTGPQLAYSKGNTSVTIGFMDDKYAIMLSVLK